MRRAYLFVEGSVEANFLRRILPGETLTDVEFVERSADSSRESLARTLLITRRKPLVMVIKSASLDPYVTKVRRQEIEEFVRMANWSVPVKVISIVPEMEAWFFAAPAVIERILGCPVSPEWIKLGKRDPTGILQHLGEASNKTWDSNQAINELDSTDIEYIRALPDVMELTNFLTAAQKMDQAA